MRVLLLSNLFPTVDRPFGGVFVERRIEHLRAQGVDVLPVALVPRSGRVITQVLERTGRDPYRMDGVTSSFDTVSYRMSPADYLRNGRSYPTALIRQAAREVVTWLGDGEVDVVHGHGMFVAAAGAVAQAVASEIDRPYVVSMHGSDVNLVMPHMAREYSRALASAGATIYVSDRLRDTAVGLGAPRSRSHVIPNGVDLETFRPRGGTRGDTVCYIGNLYEVKGADRLPAIFRAVSSAHPAARFRVVGDGYLRSRLESEMAGLPVEFTGRLAPDEVATEMSAAAVLVAPSRNEGWPCVVLESHATGTPVVASAAGGLPEAIGDLDFVVRDEDPVPGIAARIVAVLRGELVPGDITARARAFGWEEIVAQEVAVMERIVAGHPST